MADPALIIQNSFVRFALPSTAKIVHLEQEIDDLERTMHDQATGADYQVPTGKKLWILNVRGYDDSMNIECEIYSHDTVDTAGGTKITTFHYPTTTQLDLDFPLYEFAAGQYVNIQHLGTSQLADCQIYAVELDA